MRKLVRYSVTIPEAHLRYYTRAQLNRAADVINAGPIEDGDRERLAHLHAVRYTGRAPSEIVTLLAAMAQGHPLDAILDDLDHHGAASVPRGTTGSE